MEQIELFPEPVKKETDKDHEEVVEALAPPRRNKAAIMSSVLKGEVTFEEAFPNTKIKSFGTDIKRGTTPASFEGAASEPRGHWTEEQEDKDWERENSERARRGIPLL